MFWFLLAAMIIFSVMAVCFFFVTLGLGYAYKTWRGLLTVLGLFALFPASFGVVLAGMMFSVLFTEDPPKDGIYPDVVSVLWLVACLAPFGTMLVRGIMRRNKAQILTGAFGLATVCSVLAAILCLAFSIGVSA